MQVSATALVEALQAIADAGIRWGHTAPETPQRILIEYVSADPNGPLLLNHARGGVLGDTLSALLTFAGHTVSREFYVNDATNSRQLDRFARVLLHRYRSLLFEAGIFDGDLPPLATQDYPEAYVTEIARKMIERDGDRFLSLSEDDALNTVKQTAWEIVGTEQRERLELLGLRFDNWFSEAQLHERGAVQQTLNRLREAGYAYEKSGALWLRSTAFGETSDHTLMRPDGSPTYLAGDLAYHADKFERGYDRLIDVWNTDHAIYVERTRAGLAALGYDPARLTVLLHAPVRLLKNGTEVRGTRLSGPDGSATLGETLPDLPASALRLLLLSRPAGEPVDVNADVVNRRDRSNPAAFLQDTLRRAISEAGKAATVRDIPDNSPEQLKAELAPLVEELTAFPQVVHTAAAEGTPDRLLTYALSVAERWNRVDAAGNSFPLLARAVTITLTNTLDILGVSHASEMPAE